MDLDMWIPIKAHAFLWSHLRDKGIIKLILSNKEEYKITVKSPWQFLVIAEILRDGKAAFYNTETESVSSAWESDQNLVSSKDEPEHRAAFINKSDNKAEETDDLSTPTK